MTKQEAHQLLNAVKCGLQLSMRDITQALQATGDLDPFKRVYKESPPVFEAPKGELIEFELVPKAIPVEEIPEEPPIKEIEPPKKIRVLKEKIYPKRKPAPYVMKVPKLVHAPWSPKGKTDPQQM